MCRELKGKQALAKVLKRAHDATLKNYNDAGDEDDLRELLDPPHIVGNIFLLTCFFSKNKN